MNKVHSAAAREPHNIEAEQALLGAILINNEAFYRVSDFLEPKHFFEEIHRHLRAGRQSYPRRKARDAGDAQDVLAGGPRHRRPHVNQYLARLAAEATTIINAEDYGRTVYDLSIRRDLIAIGEDIVNLAYDAPVDATPLSQIEMPDRRCTNLPE